MDKRPKVIRVEQGLDRHQSAGHPLVLAYHDIVDQRPIELKDVCLIFAENDRKDDCAESCRRDAHVLHVNERVVQRKLQRRTHTSQELYDRPTLSRSEVEACQPPSDANYRADVALLRLARAPQLVRLTSVARRFREDILVPTSTEDKTHLHRRCQ